MHPIEYPLVILRRAGKRFGGRPILLGKRVAEQFQSIPARRENVVVARADNHRQDGRWARDARGEIDGAGPVALVQPVLDQDRSQEIG